MSTRLGELLMVFQRPSSQSISSAVAVVYSAMLELSLVTGFISTLLKEVSPMLFKSSRRGWSTTIVHISSSLPGAPPFACWQDRLRQPNQPEKKRCRYSRPDSESDRMTFSR